jgi:hypothetical protein
MADNFVANAGSGGSTFASDEISSVHYPRVKLSWGADGAVADASVAAPIPVELVATAAAGLTIFRSLDLDEGALEVVKASAGVVYAIEITNRSTAARYVKFSNAASGTVGTTAVVMTLCLEGSAGMSWSIPQGIAFSTGITVGASTGLADNDTGAPAANDVVCHVFYK